MFPFKSFTLLLLSILMTSYVINIYGPEVYLLIIYLFLASVAVLTINHLIGNQDFILKLVWPFSFILCIAGCSNDVVFWVMANITLISFLRDSFWVFSEAYKKVIKPMF